MKNSNELHVAVLRRPEVLDRIEEKIDKSAGPDGCWPWMAYDGPFPVVHEGEKITLTIYRMVWIIANGPIPPGRKRYVVRCLDNKLCCNPKHLSLGSKWDVARAALERGERRAARNRAEGAERIRRDMVARGLVVDTRSAGGSE